MKRLGAVISLVLIMIMLSASFVFAADAGNLKIKEVYPKDGATGTSIDNLSVKLYFNEDVKPKTKEVKKANEDAITLTDSTGKHVPILVKYNPDKDKIGQVIILADAVSETSGNDSKSAKIKGNTEYTFTVDKSFESTNGDSLGKTQKISFKTVNQSQATKIQMLLMGIMVAAMIFFTMRSTKKQAEKDKEEKEKKKKQNQAVNPYKVAKKTGRSVEEVVKKDQEKKAKLAEKEERKKAREEKRNSKGEIVEEIADGNKRVSKPRPISAAGSTFKANTSKPETEKPENKQGKTTNPKNQTGKQKNKKKK